MNVLAGAASAAAAAAVGAKVYCSSPSALGLPLALLTLIATRASG